MQTRNLIGTTDILGAEPVYSRLFQGGSLVFQIEKLGMGIGMYRTDAYLKTPNSSAVSAASMLERCTRTTLTQGK